MGYRVSKHILVGVGGHCNSIVLLIHLSAFVGMKYDNRNKNVINLQIMSIFLDLWFTDLTYALRKYALHQYKMMSRAGFHIHCHRIDTCVRNVGIHKTNTLPDRDNRLLQNIGTHLPNYTASRSTAFRPSHLEYFVHSLFLQWKGGHLIPQHTISWTLSSGISRLPPP